MYSVMLFEITVFTCKDFISSITTVFAAILKYILKKLEHLKSQQTMEKPLL